MSFLIQVTKTAESDIDEGFQFLHERAPAAAVRWFRSIWRAIFSLENNPTRCHLSPEGRSEGLPVRKLLHGKKGRRVDRILFEVRKKTVYILHIRHGARRKLSPEEIHDALRSLKTN